VRLTGADARAAPRRRDPHAGLYREGRSRNGRRSSRDLHPIAAEIGPTDSPKDPFFKTDRGARVGDLYMSLVYTAQLAGVSPFDDLVALQRHTQAAAACPSDWMPWSYEQARSRLEAAEPSSAAAHSPDRSSERDARTLHAG